MLCTIDDNWIVQMIDVTTTFIHKKKKPLTKLHSNLLFSTADSWQCVG